MNNMLLNPEHIKILKEMLDKKCTLVCCENDGYEEIEKMHEYLIQHGLAETTTDEEVICHYPMPNTNYYRITEAGRVALHSLHESQKRNALEWLRYWITTGIAAAAFIISVIALLR